MVFVGELEILKRFKHPHIVEFIGSYTDPTFFALMMTPVAEMDLAKCLSIASPEHVPIIRTPFMCLVTTLEYLHDTPVRHKDIKPHNILVRHGNAPFTDFGLSRDSNGADSTTSRPSSLTPRYCAPEIAMHERRSYSSGIWSIGCVFFEMLVVLNRCALEYMKDHFASHGSRQPFVRTNPVPTEELFAYLKGRDSISDNIAVLWIRGMLRPGRGDRPPASVLLESITISPDGLDSSRSAFRGLCCAETGRAIDGLGENDDLDNELFR